MNRFGGSVGSLHLACLCLFEMRLVIRVSGCGEGIDGAGVPAPSLTVDHRRWESSTGGGFVFGSCSGYPSPTREETPQSTRRRGPGRRHPRSRDRRRLRPLSTQVGKKPAGAIEARREGVALVDIEAQTRDYADKVPSILPVPIRPVPLPYESTGVETRHQPGRPDGAGSAIDCQRSS